MHSMSCNMGARDSPDMYALGLRAYISGKSHAPMLQLLLNARHRDGGPSSSQDCEQDHTLFARGTYTASDNAPARK